MKFKSEDLRELVSDGEELPEAGLRVVRQELVDTTRWCLVYDLVFSHGDKFYQTSYRIGATEYQDERPFEFDGAEVECAEVRPVQKTITVYE